MIQLIIIAVYLSLLLGLGLFASRLFRGTSKDYMLASHSIGPIVLLMSLFGTTMTAFALVGSTSEAFKEGVGVYGMLASSSGIIHSLCFFVLGVKLWTLGRRHGYKTQIQFFRDRLESDKIGLLLFPALVGMVIPYLLIGVMASGGVINGVTSGRQVVDERDADNNIVAAHIEKPTFAEGTFPNFLEHGDHGYAIDGSKGGVPRHLASLVICIVVLIYVFFGGMRGTAWANTFQTCVFMVLGLVTFCVIADHLGGLALKNEAVAAGAAEDDAKAASESAPLHKKITAVSRQIPDSKRTREGMPKLVFFTYLLVPLSVGMFPHLFQHWLTARRASTFKLAVVAHPIFIMIVWVPCVLIGVWATTGIIKMPPAVLENPNLVLPVMVKSLAGPILGGLLTAGILAAIMSSLDSQFLCLGTMFTEDMAVHYRGKERVSDRQEILLARLFIVAIVALTYFFSTFEPRGVFTLGVWCFSGFASLFPLVLAALYWRRLTKAGAYASVLAAIGTWLFLFWKSGFAEDENFYFDVVIGSQHFEFMPVAAMVAASLTALIVVSLVTRPPSEETLAKFFD